jgi:hypothetical protein
MNEEKDLATTPYIVYAVSEAKYQKQIKQLLWALAGTNLFWIILFIIG